MPMINFIFPEFLRAGQDEMCFIYSNRDLTWIQEGENIDCMEISQGSMLLK